MIDNYSIRETLHSDHFSTVRRAVHSPTGRVVILKTCSAEFPNANDIARIYNEWSILQRLHGEYIIEAEALIESNGPPVLVLADGQAPALGELCGAPVDVELFFCVATRLATALHTIHASGILHKDIKPDNILFDAKTRRFRLIDFNIAMPVAHAERLDQVESLGIGTLPYIAPEQTGRIGRVVDERADLYSAGVVLYLLLTGRLPFVAQEPMELIHQQLTTKPPPIRDFTERAPQSVVDIVARLLAKSPDDRYQSARGLLYDLEEAERRWRGEITIDELVIGQRDVSPRLHLPHSLYGRERELESLMAAGTRVRAGETLFVGVSGAAGGGKSSLVHAFGRSDIGREGLMGSGKCEELQQSTPQEPILDALRQVVRGLLAEDDRVADAWAARIGEAVSPNGGLLLEVLPELELIIGAQPPPPEVSFVDGGHRFQDTVRKLVQCFARPGHPLVLFLDDLQWADPATLATIQALLCDPDAAGLLVIGAYRRDDVAEGHGLARMLSQLETKGAAIERVTIDDLSRADVDALIADTLRTEPDHVASLSALVHAKTGGNPFFVRQFLSTLYSTDLLSLDVDRGVWVWDEDAIGAADLTDNVVELMITRMRELPAAVQELLQWAAFLGFRCTLPSLLALAPDAGLVDIAGRLLTAVGEGLLSTNAENERLLALLQARAHATLEPEELSRVEVRFLHDRVREAACALVPQGERSALHLRIGRFLREHSSEEEIARQLFDIVEHYHSGHALSAPDGARPWHEQHPEEALEVAMLALRAATRALSANAYDAVVRYTRFASALLPDDAWNTRYELVSTATRMEAEALSLLGDHDAADALCRDAESKVRTVVEKAELYGLRVRQYISSLDYDEALELLRAQLMLFGHEFPASDGDTQELIGPELGALLERLGSQPAKLLLGLPKASGSEHELVHGAFGALHRVGYLSGRPGISVLGALRAMTHTVENGITSSSDLAVAVFGYLLMHAFGQPALGIAIGQVAVQLLARNPSTADRVHGELMVSDLVLHWHQPVLSLLPLIEKTIVDAEAAGAFEPLGYCLGFQGQIALFGGLNLSQARAILDQSVPMARRIRADAMLGVIVHYVRMLDLTDRGLSPVASSVVSSAQATLGEPALGTHALGTRVTVGLRYALHRPVSDEELATLLSAPYIESVRSTLSGQPMMWEATFSSCMHHLRLAGDGEGSTRDEHLAAASESLSELRGWAENGNVNLDHKLRLVEAELARLEGRPMDALRAYEQAMELAVAIEHPADEALAAERVAALCRESELSQLERHYMVRARAAYDRWGATVKVREIDDELGRSARAMLRSSRSSSGSGSISSSSGSGSTRTVALASLDIGSVSKAALSIAQEIRLPQLLEALLRVLMENAGAERAAVLMARDDQMVVVAEASSANQITIHREDARPLASWSDGPRSIVRYVKRTHDIETVEDATSHDVYSTDPYIAANKVLSVLCLPIIRQGELVAAVYLENRLVRGSFTYSHVALLEVLAGQIATSLENAGLYADLERALQELAESERLKHEFLAMVSHELRTPLNAIINLPQVIRDALPEPSSIECTALDESLQGLSVAELRQVLEMIHHGGHRLLTEIDQLILFSRLEAGTLPFEPKHLSLEQSIEQGLTSLRTAADDRGITIRVDGSATSTGPVRGDARLVPIIISNLLSNAIKFSPAGSTVDVSATRAGPFVELSVRDVGSGIAESERELIFESFRQVSAGTKRRHGGTGLGLAVTKKLVDLHGGTISVDSVPGKGSVFSVHLPC